MRLDFGLGRSPRAGSAALSSEEARHAAQQGGTGSTVIAAGRSARMADQSRSERTQIRMPELSINNTGSRRERIFKPRPQREEVTASSVASSREPDDADATPQTASLMRTEVDLEKDLDGKHPGAISASQPNSRWIAGSFSPFESVLRLFSKHKVPNKSLS